MAYISRSDAAPGIMPRQAGATVSFTALVSFVALTCATCAAAAPPSGVPAGYLTETEGFVDIDLPITQIAQDSGQTRVIARGVILGKEVGLEIDFPSRSPRSRSQASMPPGTAQIRTLGAVS